MRYEMLRNPLTLLAAAGVLAGPVRLSDPVAIYATIDKVVLTPETNPTTIQIWGTFSLSDQQFGDHYQPANKGYLYYTLNSGDAKPIRAEWADLQKIAGKKVIAAFGGKYVRGGLGRVRCATEQPMNPDAYPFGGSVGVSTSQGQFNSGWPIAKDLIDHATPSKCPK